MKRRSILSVLALFLIFFIVGCGRIAPTPVGTAVPSPTSTLANTPQPTATATQTPLPTATATSVPTPDLRPTWSWLIYINADQQGEAMALADLAEMVQGVAKTNEVQLVVQLDRSAELPPNMPTLLQNTAIAQQGTETHRYLISADELREVEKIGEVTMTDPATLADFISWGVEKAPAQHYALLLWGVTAHTIGGQFDLTPAGKREEPRGFTLSTLEQALNDGISRSGISQFDLIGLPSGVMGQLELFTTLEQYGNYVIASQDVVPEKGWDYQPILAGSDGLEAEALAQRTVSAFTSQYLQSGDVASLAAIKSAELPPVRLALDQLAGQLVKDQKESAESLHTVRTMLPSLAAPYLVGGDSPPIVDLGRFVRLLAQESSLPTLKKSTAQLLIALDQAVIKEWHSPLVPFANGISIYFPNEATSYNAIKGDTTPLSEWGVFLSSFISQTLPAPDLQTLDLLSNEKQISLIQPFYWEYQTSGGAMKRVVHTVEQQIDENRRWVLAYQKDWPTPTLLEDGSEPLVWGKGIHSKMWVQLPFITTLSDGKSADSVIFWSLDPEERYGVVQGNYWQANGSIPLSANLVFDRQEQKLIAIWGGDWTAPLPITPQDGDRFETKQFYREEDVLIAAPSVQLSLDSLSYSNEMLPNGKYLGRVSAESATGDEVNLEHQWVIDNTDISTTSVGYLDPLWGFQFTYLSAWSSPIYDPEYGNTLLYAQDQSGEVNFQVKIFTRDNFTKTVSAEVVKQAVLSEWTGLSLIHQDTTTIGDEFALRTIYGYVGENGKRQGVLATFIHDGIGFAIDLEMPASQQTQLMAASRSIFYSWQFLSVGLGRDSARWARFAVNSAEIVPPEGFQAEKLTNGWTRYRQQTNPATFVALRSDAISRRAPSEISLYWSDLALRGLQKSKRSDVQAFAFVGEAWSRFDFSYENADGQLIKGVLMSSISDQERVLWAEAPAELWDAFLEKTVWPLGSAEWGQ